MEGLRPGKNGINCASCPHCDFSEKGKDPWCKELHKRVWSTGCCSHHPERIKEKLYK